MGRDLPLNVLFVVPYAPTRIRTRPFHLIRALSSLGHRLTVATLFGGDDEQAAVKALPSQGAQEVIAEHLSRTRPLRNCARALLTADPLQAHFSWNPVLARRLDAALAGRRFDVVHVEHLRGSRYALALAEASRAAGGPRVPVVWDSVDCISSLFRHAAGEAGTGRVRLAAKLELARTERYEGRVVPGFDRVVVTSETDRRDLLQLVQPGERDEASRRLSVVPNGVDLEYFSPTCEARQPRTLVVTGKMSYHANATAVVRFVEDVMPSVWASLPDARLTIVGKDPPREVLRLSARGIGRVVVTGTVEDIRPYLRTAALAVAPIQYGVGIQNKVLEALACGTPVVATGQAVSALSARPGEELEVARDAHELSAAVVRLLHDSAHRDRMGTAGRQYVEREHGWRQVAERLSEVYRGAAS